MELKTYDSIEDSSSIESTTSDSGFISNEIHDLLNKQKDNELYNHHLYKQVANYFKMIGLLKIYAYYEKRAHEEYNHHQWIVNYLNSVNCGVKYDPIIIKESANFKDCSNKEMINMFDLTIQKEIETTEKISIIFKKAFDEQDFVTTNWLQEQLIPEQHEEEATSLKAFQIAQQESDWLTKEISILELLNE